MEEAFPAKVMLFGEYSLLYGSQAITIPYPGFTAHLAFPHSKMDARELNSAKHSNRKLREFQQFLISPHAPMSFRDLMNMEAFGLDLKNGIYLLSNVPSGYGLGSSGVLVASVFHRYAHPTNQQNMKTEYDENTLSQLKQVFASMEGYFHHNSSGLDPLSSYIKQPLLTQSGHCQTTLFSPLQPKDTFFLLNTGRSRNTSALVQSFEKKAKDPGFKKIMTEQYLPCNDRCIDDLLGQPGKLKESIRQLSDLQRVIFPNLIPEKMIKVWDEGLTKGIFSLKLCGAGGGGYLLGFTNNIAETRNLLREYTMQPIPLKLP